MAFQRFTGSLLSIFLTLSGAADEPLAAPQVTSLTNVAVEYTVPKSHHVVLKRSGVTAVIVDNAAVDVPELPGHRAGYNGIASFSHDDEPRNLFVPSYAGLNFEHIHDGTTANLKNKFEPRAFPMQLRVIDEFTVEVYQSPTDHWKLESCGRYRLLEDGVIEYTFECIPRQTDYENDYIGLFWASYIDHPLKKSIFFKGGGRKETGVPRWIEGITPAHGVESTHAPSEFSMLPKVETDFPLTLVNHPSPHLYSEPWYFGLRGKMAFVQMFRMQDRIWFAQSPTGGGQNNPAWDFQWFIPNPKVGRVYGFVMRATLISFESLEKIVRETAPHRRALNPNL
ncbi:MAG: hypothetical protein GWQ08_07970 [Verrucomicrobiaceae bacterium]|nr:hypothetical protein [Verrucomicrobiaceae bacterium]